MRSLPAACVLLTAALCRADSEPLWSLKEVLELSNLLNSAQGRDRSEFLSLLEDAEEDDSTTEANTEEASSEAAESSEAAPSTSTSMTMPVESTSDSAENLTTPTRSPQNRRSPPNRRGGGNGGGGRGGGSVPQIGGGNNGGFNGGFPDSDSNLRGPQRFQPLDEADGGDSMKWFNAQMFVKWFVHGLASIYESLIHLLLMPMRIVIGFIDV